MQERSVRIALFTVTFSHLHYDVIKRVCEANYKIARNCLAYMMQMAKVNRGKGYFSILNEAAASLLFETADFTS